MENNSNSEQVRVLVIDDEPSICTALRLILYNAGYNVVTASGGQQGIELIRNENFDIILCDLQMPDINGMEVLRQTHSTCIRKGSIVIMMSAYGTIEIALKAIKLGAYDYVPKPFNAEEITLTLRKAEERQRLKRENELLKRQIAKKYSLDSIVGKSSKMVALLETLKRISGHSSNVLILGESGTGKEVIARAIHHNSPRKRKPFVAINCAAVPENLMESELFGYRKGAFTDAVKDKRGLFEEANGGTLLLDEIGELSPQIQVKLLRTIQEREIQPIGEGAPVPVDIRVIAATLRDLEQDIADGRFREDLYYRLNVIRIDIPPLRERIEDIPLLVEHFIEKHSVKMNFSQTSFAPMFIETLSKYAWPGNIRELENCIEHCLVMSKNGELSVDLLPSRISDSAVSVESILMPSDSLSIKEHTRWIEKNLITRALGKTGGNRTHAAKLLEISHRTLLYKLKEYGL